ncbi:hypothetical protein C8Q75DRAFT_769674 [Abortiporus biennis]|nr:hypothetical protein C8Q75DRAFT_769674 [Abortiporus biennis]
MDKSGKHLFANIQKSADTRVDSLEALSFLPSSTSTQSFSKVSLVCTIIMFRVVICALASLFISSNALPLTRRDAVAPPITSPDASTVWQVGTIQTVTWDTSNLPPPANITNPTGKVILGFLTDDSENLMADSPLAQGFPITQGSVQITVPDVPSRTNYIIALIGDSGNISPLFSITGGSAAPSSGSASPTSTVTSPPISESSSTQSEPETSSPTTAVTFTAITQVDTGTKTVLSGTAIIQSTTTVPAATTISTQQSSTNNSPNGALAGAASSLKNVGFTSVLFSLLAAAILA